MEQKKFGINGYDEYELKLFTHNPNGKGKKEYSLSEKMLLEQPAEANFIQLDSNIAKVCLTLRTMGEYIEAGEIKQEVLKEESRNFYIGEYVEVPLCTGQKSDDLETLQQVAKASEYWVHNDKMPLAMVKYNDGSFGVIENENDMLCELDKNGLLSNLKRVKNIQEAQKIEDETNIKTQVNEEVGVCLS